MNLCDLEIKGQSSSSRNFFQQFWYNWPRNNRIDTKMEFISCLQPKIRKVTQKGVWPWVSRSCNKDRFVSLLRLDSLTPQTYPWEIFSKYWRLEYFVYRSSIGFMVMCIISTVTSCILLAFGVIGAVRQDIRYCESYYSSSYYCSEVLELNIQDSIILVKRWTYCQKNYILFFRYDIPTISILT